MLVGGPWDHSLPLPHYFCLPRCTPALRLVPGGERKQQRVPEDPTAGVDTAL